MLLLRAPHCIPHERAEHQYTDRDPRYSSLWRITPTLAILSGLVLRASLGGFVSVETAGVFADRRGCRARATAHLRGAHDRIDPLARALSSRGRAALGDERFTEAYEIGWQLRRRRPETQADPARLRHAMLPLAACELGRRSGAAGVGRTRTVG
jgi:hypothetical protein